MRLKSNNTCAAAIRSAKFLRHPPNARECGQRLGPAPVCQPRGRQAAQRIERNQVSAILKKPCLKPLLRMVACMSSRILREQRAQQELPTQLLPA